MDDINDLTRFYSINVEELSLKIKRLKKRETFFTISEIIAFLLSAVLLVLYFVKDFPVLTIAVISFVAYIVIRKLDVRNDRLFSVLTKRFIVYNNELSYLKGDYTVFETGSRYVDVQHPFTYDLDIFGEKSLFNRINRTVTTGGSDMLANSLQTLPLDLYKVELKRDAVRELAQNEVWRTEFVARGMNLKRNNSVYENKINTKSVIDSIRRAGEVHLPYFFNGKLSLMVVIVVLVGFFATILAASLGVIHSSVPVNYGLLQLMVILSLTGRPFGKIQKVVEDLQLQLKDFYNLVKHIHDADFKSDELTKIQTELFNDDIDALKAFRDLSNMLGSLDRRGNLFGLIVFNVLFLNDFFLVRHFIKWQQTYLTHLEHWIVEVSRVDALVSMSILEFNHPEANDAEVIESENLVYEAKGLYHPFLGSGAVTNDFVIHDSNYYIITGANMAGKSTFLRALGINYILAMNGMPVFSTSYKVSLFNLFSSMRTTDDLSNGISYFNAELIRLQQLIDNCKNADRSLIILDEILKGTNSVDKLNGSRMFLKAMSRFPISGIIATHDLELSKMEDENPERFHNYCFEIELSDNVNYSYKISDGVARNQNATYLLQRILKEA